MDFVLALLLMVAAVLATVAILVSIRIIDVEAEMPNTRYVIVPEHGESRMLFNVLDTWAPEDERPLIAEQFDNRESAMAWIKKSKVHYRSLRHFVNGGMLFPECASSAPLLDLDKANWITSGDTRRVTCHRCLVIIKAQERREVRS
jgi:hypothetical protein